MHAQKTSTPNAFGTWLSIIRRTIDPRSVNGTLKDSKKSFLLHPCQAYKYEHMLRRCMRFSWPRGFGPKIVGSRTLEKSQTLQLAVDDVGDAKKTCMTEPTPTFNRSIHCPQSHSTSTLCMHEKHPAIVPCQNPCTQPCMQRLHCCPFFLCVTHAHVSKQQQC